MNNIAFLKYQIFNPSLFGADTIHGLLKFSNNMPAININVSLFLQGSFKYLESASTDKSGAYEFSNYDLANNEYYVIAHDPTKKYNGAIADNIGGKNVVDWS